MEFLPTKGMEYILILAYLPLLIVAWWMIRRGSITTASPVTASASSATRGSGWFDVPDGVYYHPGHTWVIPEGDNVFRVGWDDFARRLVGRTPAGLPGQNCLSRR